MGKHLSCLLLRSLDNRSAEPTGQRTNKNTEVLENNPTHLSGSCLFSSLRDFISSTLFMEHLLHTMDPSRPWGYNSEQTQNEQKHPALMELPFQRERQINKSETTRGWPISSANLE